MALLGAREELETISGRLSLAETLNMVYLTFKSV